MGLDMYLHGEKYIVDDEFSLGGTWAEEAAKGKKIAEIISSPAEFSVSAVRIRLAYWRKANAIHQWFVENTQSGEDQNGQDSYVSREQIEELVDICKQILEDPRKGPGLLPTQKGFFFGGTEYDEGYLQDLTLTVKQLTKVLEKLPDDYTIYYQSSW